MLWQERIVTTFGLWARSTRRSGCGSALTHGTLVVESSAPFLILRPCSGDWTRAAAILLIGIHVGIALLVNVGIFSAAMMAF